MPEGMIGELQNFLISAFWGMLMIVYYDFFRIMRVMIRHTTLMVAIEDLVFALGTGCMILAVSYNYMQGQIRGYLLLGMVVGGIFYNFGISLFLRGFLLFFINKIKELLKKNRKQSTIECNHNAKEGNDE